MTITFSNNDRKMFMKRFRAAQKKDRPDEVVTVFYIDEVSVAQQYE